MVSKHAKNVIVVRSSQQEGESLLGNPSQAQNVNKTSRIVYRAIVETKWLHNYQTKSVSANFLPHQVYPVNREGEWTFSG